MLIKCNADYFHSHPSKPAPSRLFPSLLTRGRLFQFLLIVFYCLGLNGSKDEFIRPKWNIQFPYTKSPTFLCHKTEQEKMCSWALAQIPLRNWIFFLSSTLLFTVCCYCCYLLCSLACCAIRGARRWEQLCSLNSGIDKRWKIKIKIEATILVCDIYPKFTFHFVYNIGNIYV